MRERRATQLLEVLSNSGRLFKELRTVCEPVTLAPRSLGWEAPEFKAHVPYIVKPCSRQTGKHNKELSA